MHSGKGRDVLPDISSIVEFSKRLLSGVSQEEAQTFLGREKVILTTIRRSNIAIDPKRVRLLKESLQYGDVDGNKVRGYLRGEILLSEHHLAWFLENQYRIPEIWRGDGNNEDRFIFFWGDVRESFGTIFVPFLFFSEGKWKRSIREISQRWHSNYYAAVYDPEF